jgi:hypothetical protein
MKTSLKVPVAGGEFNLTAHRDRHDALQNFTLTLDTYFPQEQTLTLHLGQYAPEVLEAMAQLLGATVTPGAQGLS